MRATSVAEANPIKIALLAALLFQPVLLNTRAAADGLRPDDNLQAAHEAYEASDYPKAARLLQLAVEQHPRDAEVHLLLAKTYYETQQHDAAIASAEKAVALDPQSSLYHEWLGKVYGEKASHASMFSALSLAKKARKEFAKAVDLDEKNFSANQALIEFDCSAPGIAGGGEDKARPEIAKLAALDAAEGYYAAGNCRRQKKDFTAADAEFTKALDAKPTSADLIYDIGDYAMKREQAERLLAVAEAGETVSPSDPRGKFYRAVARILRNETSGDAEQAIRDYLQHAPKRNNYPSPAFAHYWLGRLAETRGQAKAATEEYAAAVKLDPKNKLANEALKRAKKN